MSSLTMEVAAIISLGRDSKSSVKIAQEIVDMLEQKAKRSNHVGKPKRGIGVVSQADLLRGR